jgi:hypothetical protein
LYDTASPDDRDVTHLKKRYDALKGTTERSNWEAHCEEVAELVMPRKRGFVGERTAGEKRMQKVFDSTGIYANSMLAAGLHGMATNPASKWFSLRLTDFQLNESDAAKQWLDVVQRIMRERMYQPGSNITTALHEAYQDLGAFGTACVFIGQRDNGALLFECRPMHQIVYAENIDGKVDTVFRCSDYTVSNLVAEFGLSEVSEQTRDAYNAQKYDQQVKVIHAVHPRKERDRERKDAKNHPFASCYFEHTSGHKLRESGFQEFPYLIARWNKLSGEVYGRSPAMEALPDLKMLQAMMLTTIKAAQKATDPPLFVPDDGVVGPIRTVPGGINYYRGNREIFPMPTSDKLSITETMMDGLRQRILRTFFADLFQVDPDVNMTATEFMQRVQERMRLLGPVIGRLEGEMLGPLIERIYGILERDQTIPLAPPELKEADFTVEYVSPIASAQRQTEANGIAQVFQYIGMLGPELAGPAIMKRFDVDKTLIYLWDLFNNKPDLLKSDEEVQQAEQQEQAMMAAQMAGPAAQAANQGAGAVKHLADAQAGGGIDMSQLMAQAAEPENQAAGQDMASQMMGAMGGA